MLPVFWHITSFLWFSPVRKDFIDVYNLITNQLFTLPDDVQTDGNFDGFTEVEQNDEETELLNCNGEVADDYFDVNQEDDLYDDTPVLPEACLSVCFQEEVNGGMVLTLHSI